MAERHIFGEATDEELSAAADVARAATMAASGNATAAGEWVEDEASA